jgi:HAD superfamily hydrolase (TIGR01509 family)
VIPVKAFLFDFDGVLADTEPLHWTAWLEVLGPYSPDLDWETYQRRCVGTSDIEMLQFFSEITAIPVTTDELKALYPQKRNIFQALATVRPIIDEDLVRMLASVNGLSLGVVTSSNQAEVEPILKQAGLLEVLDTVVYGNDVTHYKPHPEPYQIALARLGVEPSEAIVFEDSASGIRSASEAGCHVVTVHAPADLPGLVEAVLTDQSPDVFHL